MSISEQNSIISLPPIKSFLHLPTLRNRHVQIRHILAPASSLGCLHLPHDIHAINDPAKDDVLAVEEGCGYGGDEELGAVGVGTGVLWVRKFWLARCRSSLGRGGRIEKEM